MNIPLNIIKKYTDIELDHEQLIEHLRQRLGEVEEVINLKEKYKGIIVAEIVEKDAHPDAEKLDIYQVNIGKKTVQVVAGDKELKVGDKVAYIIPGHKVPHNAYPDKFDGIIKKVKLRGKESNGMLASAKELDFSNNHERVLALDTDAEIGTPLTEAYELDDVIVDIENKALANRGDCFGLIGIAREIAGIQGLQFNTPEWFADVKKELSSDISDINIEVKVEAGDLCPRYSIFAIKDIEIKASSIEMQINLMKCGIRPVNNIVDITNYMMLLTGQPTHAFDLDKVIEKDSKASENQVYIEVRKAKQGEKITTIDHKTRELDDTMLAICDSESPIAVAGVMGGLDTEVSEDSTNILIESANFNRFNIRKTSMKLGLNSDAVKRYTKRQDPSMCQSVAAEIAKQIQSLNSEAKVVSDYVDIYSERVEEQIIELDLNDMRTLLGVDLSDEEISQILSNIELNNSVVEDNKLEVTVPTWRRDIEIAEDIYEDVGRLYGYSRIAKTLPKRTIMPTPINQILTVKSEIKNNLVGLGATEIKTYNFTSQELLHLYETDMESVYHIRNPLSPELEYMRTSLLPSAVEKVMPNISDGYKEFALFEINKVHNKIDKDVEENLPYEFNNLSFITTADDSISDKYDGSPYFGVKQYFTELMRKLKVRKNEISYQLLADVDLKNLPIWMRNLVSGFDMNSAAVVSVKLTDREFYLGILGDFSPKVKNHFKLPVYTSGFEINIDQLIELISIRKVDYKEPSQYPQINFDLCFVVDKNISFQEVLELMDKALEEYELKLQSDVEPVDIYQSDEQKVDNKKQMTYRVKVRSHKDTIDQKTSKAIVQNIVSKVTNEIDAELKE